MKLEINLADRDEIAAAVPLLQLILGGTAAAPAPLPAAPSTADVAPSPIAPGVAPASLMLPPAAPTMPAPPPAPVVVAPAAPAAPMSPASGVVLDSKGLPWDPRIHASTKAVIPSGEWKAKRGVEPALVAQVEAELRAVSPPQAAGLDAAALAFGGAAAPVPLPPPAPPVAPLPFAAPVVLSADAGPTTFEQLMTLISPLVVAGKLPPTATNQAATANGLASIVALQTAPQFVPLVWATLKQMHPAAFV